METRYRFRSIPPRPDIAETKEKSASDSVGQREFPDSWDTSYRDAYVRHPLSVREPAAGPGPGIHIGGGNLSPTDDEMQNSLYRSQFAPPPADAVPPRATSVPPSQIFVPEDHGPLATVSQLAMQEACENRPVYDNSEARGRLSDGRSSHFFFGDDTAFETNCGATFPPRRGARPPASVKLGLQRSSIEFDGRAGVGPNTKRLRKRPTFPAVGDAPAVDVFKPNFDVGYETLDYTTTTQAGLYAGPPAPPTACQAPACAELANHGDRAGPWTTVYSTDFQPRERIENQIDVADLRGTHFDPGHERDDWHRPGMAVATQKTQKAAIDLQSSNSVFRGDGEGRWHTTAGDMLGAHDRLKDGRGREAEDARASHIFLGGDDREWGTSAAEANRKAGTGRPAELARGGRAGGPAAFAQGGPWGHFTVAKTDVSERPPAEYPRMEVPDRSELRKSHFMLDATGARPVYETTYFEEICKPTLAGG
jgi:hypothetical protein